MSQKDVTPEREKLEQAIAAQEGLRGTLGDAIVDAAVAALRKQLAELEAGSQPQQQRKQVTVLFMDVANSTNIVRDLDPEDNLSILSTALKRLARPVEEHGGRVTRYMGDGFLAAFGLAQARENDPEMAVRAGLDILATAGDYASELERKRGIPGFDVRVGINTGLVIVGGGSEGEDTLTGSAVHLAARLESAATPGTLLISHHTYQHIRGVFDFRLRDPIQAKGFPEPVPVYQVLRAKPRSFRTRRRGVEGIETRMVGREAELKALQDAYFTVVEDQDGQAVTILGEAGLGKSRLLYEFENWADLKPQDVLLYRGRARQETQHLPYGLLRDLFAFRFGLKDDDPAQTVRDKVVAGFTETLEDTGDPTMKAYFAGQLLGYDFWDSPYLESARDDPQQIRDRGLVYLIDYFQAASTKDPVLLMLEDLHWADDSSLETVSRLGLALADRPVLLAATARPELYQRRPHWFEGRAFHLRLDLRPLSKRDSRLLVDEVLQRLESVPQSLRELVASNAEGNPFYVEELVKMLVEDGVLVKGEERWQSRPERLADLRVPPTLTGVLQARLESLPEEERALLQQASVVGRVFWDRVLAHLNQAQTGGPDDSSIGSLLLALREKEMVFQRDLSAFAGAREHIFKHALLREVTYESVLKRLRQAYHGLVAEWLMQNSSERAGEVIGLIADHLENAGKGREALTYLKRAAEEAAAKYANEEAVDYYGRALALTHDDDLELRFELHLSREKLLAYLGDREAQRQDLEALSALAAVLTDPAHWAQALERWARFLDGRQAAEQAEQAVTMALEANIPDIAVSAYATWANSLYELVEYEAARLSVAEGLSLARQHGDRVGESRLLNMLGLILLEESDTAEALAAMQESLDIARELDSLKEQAPRLNNLANILAAQGDFAGAQACYEQAVAVARQVGDLPGESRFLGNLGWLAGVLGDYQTARAYEESHVDIARKMGDRRGESYALVNLSGQTSAVGDYAAAASLAEQALALSRALGDQTVEAWSLTYLGHARLGLGQSDLAAAAYQAAVAIRRSLDQPELLAEPLAGLARSALAENDIEAALRPVEEILAHLASGGTLDGTDEPLRVLWTCYLVLQAAGDSRAHPLLETAYAQLQERAEKLKDQFARRTFLENIPWHRELLAEAERQGLS